MSRRSPITPASIDFSDPLAPKSIDFDDVYHARAGAAQQARHVFIEGNGLPRRWQGRPRFVILETGFGLGHNFLATWAAWRNDPQRCERLWFVSIDKHPPTRADLAQAHGLSAVRAEPFAGDGDSDGHDAHSLAQKLVDVWPPLMGGLHLLDVDDGTVRLLLAFGDITEMLRELVLQADAFYLDGFAPSRNAAMWDRWVWRALPRLAASEATAATWSVARTVREGLARAGFAVDRVPGFGDKREMTTAQFAPRHVAAIPAGRRAATTRLNDPRRALIIGAGLAGASVAQALSTQGWQITVVDEGEAVACGASGNPAGIFHGLVQGADGSHARLLRAAAAYAHAVFEPLVSAGQISGQTDGLLRVDPEATDAVAMAQEAERVLGFALPPEFAQALTAADTSSMAGLTTPHPAWFARAGGWVDPAALVRCWLAAANAQVILGRHVQALQRQGGLWVAVDEAGQPIAEAEVIVAANAGAATALLADHGGDWPLQRVRGQLSRIGAAVAAGAGLRAPAMPLAGNGYLLTMPDSSLIAGSTSQPGDDEPGLRDTDHLANLRRIEHLNQQRTGRPITINPHQLGGRVGWRCSTPDRLPVLGPVPIANAHCAGTQPRHVSREPGLYVFTALGSRGITLAPLLGEVLASWITGAPMPIEASLVDAIDAGRFIAQR